MRITAQSPLTRGAYDRHVNRVVNSRRLADQPHGSRLRLVLPLELHRLERRGQSFQRVSSRRSSVMPDASRAVHNPRPASRASLSSALESATMRNGKCV